MVEGNKTKNFWRAMLYLSPCIILLAIFTFYPVLQTFVISFNYGYNYLLSGKGYFRPYNMEGWGIQNYITIFSKGSPFLQCLLNTMIIVFVSVPISIALSLLIAVALNSIKPLQKLLQTIFFLPYVTNTIAVGMVFAVLFDKNGLINYIFGSDKSWIANAQRWDEMVPLVIYIVWSSLPFKILVFLSGLQGIDKQYYQAAQIDATPKWKTLLRITVPLLSPQILYIMITSFIGAFKEYSSIVGLFNNPGTSPNDFSLYTVVYYVYNQFNSGDLHYAAAAAVLLFIVILIFTAERRIKKNKEA